MQEYPSDPDQVPPQPSQPLYQPPTGPVPPGYYPPQQYYPPPYPYQQPDWRVTGRPVNKKAHSAQMFGLLGLLLSPFGVVAIILGFMALSEIQLTGEDGATQAKLGLGLGFVEIFLACGVYYLLVAAR